MTEMRSSQNARYEIKKVLPSTDLPRILAWLRLHRAGFHVSFPPRRVNNVYFDTESGASLMENLAGIARRVKLRLRWYGDGWNVDHGVLELKYKQGLLGWKVVQPVSGTLSLATDRWSAIVGRLREKMPTGIRHALACAPRPVLINRFGRRYFISADRAVRATLDTDFSAYTQWASSRPNVNHKVPRQDRIVLEFKAAAVAWDRLSNALDDLPGTTGKHSKYLFGILGGSW